MVVCVVIAVHPLMLFEFRWDFKFENIWCTTYWSCYIEIKFLPVMYLCLLFLLWRHSCLTVRFAELSMFQMCNYWKMLVIFVVESRGATGPGFSPGRAGPGRYIWYLNRAGPPHFYWSRAVPGRKKHKIKKYSPNIFIKSNFV